MARFPYNLQIYPAWGGRRLTMNVYVDPRLLDVAGALQVLPALPPNGGEPVGRVAVNETGTIGSGACEFARKFAPTPDKSGPSRAIQVETGGKGAISQKAKPIAVSGDVVRQKAPLTSAVRGPSEWAMTESNRRHPRCKRGACEPQAVEAQELAETLSAACTNACTSPPESVHEDAELGKILAAWPHLPESTRAQVLALIEGARMATEHKGAKRKA